VIGELGLEKLVRREEVPWLEAADASELADDSGQ
jgi:hypothetical protein